ncbi:hypothetical protein BUE80_DR011388 [Diplocarpon rosae]|nr:hypothetical protein BUE80_DR011388 [Diplocarpon rosae]
MDPNNLVRAPRLCKATSDRLSRNRTTYTDPLGGTRTWEHAERRTRPKGLDIDAVGMVTILEKETGPELLLQKQYRPPIDKVCIEVPAGLVDAGETAEQAAVRELREETGYVGVVSESSPVMFNGRPPPSPTPTLPLQCLYYTYILDSSYTGVFLIDPGFCNTNLRMVHVTVDMSKPENKNPKPRLESGEFIECFTIPLTGLYAECKQLEVQGFAIDARVATLAEGIEIARRWKL